MCTEHLDFIRERLGKHDLCPVVSDLFDHRERLMELADSLTEIKTVCACGRKATVNARIDAAGRIITEGDQVFLGGNDSYIAMCHKCWKDKIRSQKA